MPAGYSRTMRRSIIARDLWALAIASAVLFGVSLGARDLWNPNEPTYGEAVREMAAAGEWLVPTVGGREFPEKPILYFWMARVSALLLGGPHEFALRVPSAIAGVGMVLLTYLLVAPYAGRDRARVAAILVATTFVVFWSARQVQMDLLVSTSTLGAIVAVAGTIDGRIAPGRGWAVAGLAIGLGILAKGPVGVVVPGLVLGSWLASEKSLGELLRPQVLGGAAVAVAIAAPWYVALWIDGRTGFLWEVLVRQNFVRFIEPWDHAQPWWYYGKYLWIDMAPWALLLPAAIALPGRSDGERRLDRLCWTWLLVVVLFFSLSASKRSPYIMPVAPAVAALVAGAVSFLATGRLGRTRRNVVLAIHVAIATVLFGIGFLLVKEVPVERPAFTAAAWTLGILLMGGSAAVITALFNRRLAVRAVPALAVALVAAVYLAASIVALPRLDDYKSARPFCEAVPRDGRIVSYRLWRWRGEYSYYLGHTVRNLETSAELRRVSPGTAVIVEADHVGEAAAVLGVDPRFNREIGSREAFLLVAGAPSDSADRDE